MQQSVNELHNIEHQSSMLLDDVNWTLTQPRSYSFEVDENGDNKRKRQPSGDQIKSNQHMRPKK